MTENDFRKLALSFPDAIESAHMGHPDFRVGGKIFATLAPENGWAMVKVTPDQQEELMQVAPDVFSPVPGGWGRQGCTRVNLQAATKDVVRESIVSAWRLRAPKKVVKAYDAAPSS